MRTRVHLRGAARPTVAVAFAVALLASGTPAAGALDEARLREALLAHTDLPPGWASDSERAAKKRGLGVPEPEDGDCRAVFNGDADAHARAGFARTPSGPFLTTTTATHGDADAARKAVAEFRAAARDCDGFRAREGPEDDETVVRHRSAKLTVNGLGDGSAAARFQRAPASDDEPPLVTDVVLVRVGEHTVRVAQTGADDPATGSAKQLAKRAAKKLAEVADGRAPTPAPDQPGTTDL